MRSVVLLVVLSSCDVVFRLDDVRSDGSATPPDARVDALLPACGQEHSSVVAGYPVNGDADATRLTDYGPHAIHGVVTTGVIKTTPGPLDCGDALLIENDRGVTIPHDSAFDLASGSFDLWVRAVGLASTSPTRVVIARDQTGNNRGDITVFQHLTESNTSIFVARLQAGDATAGGGSYRCSNVTLTSPKWYHVAINFGPAGFELRVDGVVQDRAGTVSINGESWPCGADEDATVGIAGTQPTPWYVGFGDVFENGIVRVYLAGGGIDHFRVSSARF